MSALRNVILAVVAASAVTACQSTEVRRCEWKPKDPRYLESSNCCNKNDPSSPCYKSSDRPDRPDKPNDPRPNDPIPG